VADPDDPIPVARLAEPGDGAPLLDYQRPAPEPLDLIAANVTWVCGLAVCVPIVTGLVALACAALAIQDWSRLPRYQQRLARIGIALAFLNLAFWTYALIRWLP